ncbi:MAG: sulfur carrier protein ThiS [Rhodospirillaceae bacterium]|nr:sulfur carrier protein ThiS [Rhodospirillaceae bacterium]MCY4311789.1 sulfur carrier protein ThiS [Rhodospirillaceae bacterium]
MQIILNGETVVTDAVTIQALLEEQEINEENRGVAVALNEAVVPRSAWANIDLSEGDIVEIVQPFRGG